MFYTKMFVWSLSRGQQIKLYLRLMRYGQTGIDQSLLEQSAVKMPEEMLTKSLIIEIEHIKAQPDFAIQ